MPERRRPAVLVLRTAASALPAAAALAACGVEYRPGGRGGGDSAGPAAPAARVDTVVRVDTVFVRDTQPALGHPPDSFAVARRPEPGDTGARAGAAAGGEPVVTEADLAGLRARGLRVPVLGVRAADVPGTFGERRGGGSRPHGALDIAAPRGTPVVAAADGRVHKLFTSAAGGLTVYVLDQAGRFVYYYAHLDAYRPGLAEGAPVRAGDVLGTVGSSGNANPAAPHLHFAVARLDDPARWWAGTPVDPRPYLR